MANSTDAMLHSLKAGRIDAAILRSDAIAHAEERGLLNASSFKFVDAVSSLCLECVASIVCMHSRQACQDSALLFRLPKLHLNVPVVTDAAHNKPAPRFSAVDWAEYTAR